MKTKAWILMVLSCTMLLGLCILISVLAYTGAVEMYLAKGAFGVWFLSNLMALVVLFGYGLKRSIQLQRSFRIPKSSLQRSPGRVVCDYAISLKKYAFYKLWDYRHFSFSLLLIIYMCISLGVGHYVLEAENTLFSPIVIWFLCLIYILIMLPIRLNKRYKQTIVGQTWVEIAPEGITFDRPSAKQELAWKEIEGVAIYSGYCFLYDKSGYEFLVVTDDKRVIDAIIYYLNEKK